MMRKIHRASMNRGRFCLIAGSSIITASSAYSYYADDTDRNIGFVRCGTAF